TPPSRRSIDRLACLVAPPLRSHSSGRARGAGGPAVQGARQASVPMESESETVAQTRPFQAEVAQLLHLMVHAVYSETEVFLRELISNGSDACDKLRYEAIAKPELLADGAALAIRIKPD